MKSFKCDSCGRTIENKSDISTGYGVINGEKHCYECCAFADVEYMTDNGKWEGYLSEKAKTRTGLAVTNWPGSLLFPVTSYRSSKTNWNLWRLDFWFRGPDGYVWWGYHIGHNNQIAHCKRTKEKWARGIK